VWDHEVPSRGRRGGDAFITKSLVVIKKTKWGNKEKKKIGEEKEKKKQKKKGEDDILTMCLYTTRSLQPDATHLISFVGPLSSRGRG